MNQTLETQPSKIVGHLRHGVLTTEKRFDGGAEVTVVKAAWEMREGAERLEQRHNPRVTEAQRGDPLAVRDCRALQTVQCLLRQDAVVTDAFDFEQCSG